MPSEAERIPLSAQSLDGNEARYLQECIATNWVSSGGPFVTRFEKLIADFVGIDHAIAAINGTAALHVALLVAGVEAGDEVLVPSLTFIAPVNAIRYCGADPVLVDADPDHWQMDAGRVRIFLEKGCERRGRDLLDRATGRRVRAILPVHLLGHPAPMTQIVELARRYGLAVVEDATESLGAGYRGRAVGTLGDIACLSFNGNKLITTGGGGMIVTRNAEHAKRLRHLTTQAKCDPVEYVHDEVGYNYRLTNLQAALGCAQAERLPDFIATKRRIAARYTAALKDIPGITPMRAASWAESVFWMYTILVDGSQLGTTARGMMRHLGQTGIETRPLWQPMHVSRPHRNAPRLGGNVAERLYRDALSLPCSIGLTEAQQDRVIAAIREAVIAKQQPATELAS